MPQKVNLRESPTLYKFLKTYNIIAMFMYGAVLARLFILLPLVGRKFLSGGLNEFFINVVQVICGAEIFLSLVKLVPIQLPLIILQNALKVFIIYTVLMRETVLLNHHCYSLLILCWCSYGFIGYIYWFWKLKNIGRVPNGLLSLFQNLQLILFPITSVSEFILIFLNLKFIGEDEDRLKMATQIVLLGFIPTKFYLYKRLIFKFFKIQTEKNK